MVCKNRRATWQIVSNKTKQKRSHSTTLRTEDIKEPVINKATDVIRVEGKGERCSIFHLHRLPVVRVVAVKVEAMLILPWRCCHWYINVWKGCCL